MSTTIPLPGTSIGPRSPQLSRRRGSVAANDPFGIRAHQTQPGDREVKSRLTIVRVVQDEDSRKSFGSPIDDIPLPISGSPEHRRASWTPSPSHLRTKSIDGGRRLSFASASFTQSSPSPVMIPSSSGRRRRSSSFSSYAGRGPLSPQQLCELARTSMKPQRAHQDTDSPQSPNRLQLPLSGGEGSALSATTVPAKFIPIPDGQFLPFLDRPAEVTAFISTTPTNRLLALLEQAFPAHARLNRPSDEGDESPPSSPCQSRFASSLTNALETHVSSPPVVPSYDTTHPVLWSYSTLLAWMCTVPRSQADDTEWVHRIRACVMSHSEQIGVSLLSALGVPMEGLSDSDWEPLSPPTSAQATKATPEAPSLPAILITDDDGADSRQLPLQVLPAPSANSVNTVDGDDEAFHVDIFSIPFSDASAGPGEAEGADLDGTSRSRSGSIASWSPSSRSSSLVSSSTMESIGESESESEIDTPHDEHHYPGFGSSDEHPSGSATARAGSPTGSGIARARPAESIQEPPPHVADSTDKWDAEDQEDLYGLCISTRAMDAGLPMIPRSKVASTLPIPLTSSTRPRRQTVNVAHVLSGAPGHAGFTWRPGGPLFPTTFVGAASNNPEDASVEGGMESTGRTLVTRSVAVVCLMLMS
ncbi:hypothetical protein BV25DRAFT_1281713 [Artomyces pyxidatus]|uniref:Uncharacterized protein n=1 Tax=Artomyces pyxidatus TaxID=48021 RepID=A0ACB8TFB2_9AGAM|nr:hypothetical protein BV25DRAFT_1281713 [Artomyces pyxidatus]